MSDNEATWDAARELERAWNGLEARYRAGEMTADQHRAAMLALLDATPNGAIEMANRLDRARAGDLGEVSDHEAFLGTLRRLVAGATSEEERAIMRRVLATFEHLPEGMMDQRPDDPKSGGGA